MVELAKSLKRRDLTLEADSPEEARRAAETQLPSGWMIVAEKVLVVGTHSVTATGATVEEAEANARKGLAPDWPITKTEISCQAIPGKNEFTIQAENEEAARTTCSSAIGNGERIAVVQVIPPTARSFLQKVSNFFSSLLIPLKKYRVVVDQLACIRLEYRSGPTRVRFTFVEIPSKAEVLKAVEGLATELKEKLRELRSMPLEPQFGAVMLMGSYFDYLCGESAAFQQEHDLLLRLVPRLTGRELQIEPVSFKKPKKFDVMDMPALRSMYQQAADSTERLSLLARE
jgi:hypothetical protein